MPNYANDLNIDNLPYSGYLLNGQKTRLLFDFGTTSFQSVVFADGKFYRASTDNKVYPYDIDLNALASITLPSTGGHKNDGCFYDGCIYWLDGTASDPRALYVWNIAENTIERVDLPIEDNTNGSVRVVAGICYDATGFMCLVSRDQYNGSDIDHQEGDKMCVFRYDVERNTAEIVAFYDWDCVYVQGATFVNGKLYVACNTQTTGSASNYKGITFKIIDVERWEIVKVLTCSGDFEPQGCDHVIANGTSYIWTGLSKYATVDKVIIFENPFGTKRSISYKFAGLSTDTKPDNVPGLSVFFELDTAKTYYSKNGVWKVVG